MHCEECREAVSARLDGEDLPGEAVAVDAHLAGCPACRGHVERAAQVTRLARMGVARDVPDVTEAVLAAVRAGHVHGAGPPRLRARLALLTRAGLAAVAVGQLGLAVAAVAGTGGTHGHTTELGGASVVHFAHESAAWNLALGVGFAWVALNGDRRGASLAPLLTAFLTVLAVLSVPDLLAGRVDPDRLLGHGLVLVGLLLLLAQRGLTRGGGDGAAHDTTGGAVPGAGRGRPPWPIPSAPNGRRDEGLEPTARRAA